ncbi:MAG: hypothetical protein JXX29_12125 [Deltaproteobacteria bacterium]|nr:hypothetical protein [Deltaproteobacteria bacterium]MBN2672420.1 hypothetical protein [Deltaproteobacteria bacterium]
MRPNAEKITLIAKKYDIIKCVICLPHLPHLFIRAIYPILLASFAVYGGCTESSGEEKPLLFVAPNEIGANDDGQIEFVAEYETIVYQDVGCGEGNLYVEDSYDVYVRPNSLNPENKDWRFFCTGTLDLESGRVRCDASELNFEQLVAYTEYDVQLEGADHSRYTGLKKLLIKWIPDFGNDSDENRDSDSNVDTETDRPDGVNQMVASRTATTPDFNGALEILWSLQETIDNEEGCATGQQGGDQLFDALWNEEGLFVGVRVPDSVQTWTNLDDIRDYDSVTLFFDVPPLGGQFDENDNWIAFGSQGSRTLMKTDVALLGWGTLVTTTTYELEMGISWEALGVQPSSGMAIGFDLLIHDNDNLNNDCNLYWNENQTDAIDANTYGRIVLE